MDFQVEREGQVQLQLPMSLRIMMISSITYKTGKMLNLSLKRFQFF